MSELPDTDFTQRFLFDDADVRGELVSLGASYQHVLAKHPYPQPVAQLLGEMLAAAALLVGTLKFDGLLILQVRSSGPVPLLMIECSSEREIRGLARYNAEQIAPDATLADLMPGGDLTLTVDPTVGQRYQGIVDLDGETLSECFTNYFVMSQQVGTKFWLNADGQRARGMLLQQLPALLLLVLLQLWCSRQTQQVALLYLLTACCWLGYLLLAAATGLPVALPTSPVSPRPMPSIPPAIAPGASSASPSTGRVSKRPCSASTAPTWA